MYISLPPLFLKNSRDNMPRVIHQNAQNFEENEKHRDLIGGLYNMISELCVKVQVPYCVQTVPDPDVGSFFLALSLLKKCARELSANSTRRRVI